MTDSIDQEGVVERERQAQERASAIKAAVELLKEEILRREADSESVLLKKQAEEFLMSKGVRQKVAREAINSPAFETLDVVGKGHPKGVRLARKNDSADRNTTRTEPAPNMGSSNSDFGQPHPERATEIYPNKTPYSCGPQSMPISVEPFLLTPLPETKIEVKNDEDEVVL